MEYRQYVQVHHCANTSLLTATTIGLTSVRAIYEQYAWVSMAHPGGELRRHNGTSKRWPPA